MVMSGRRYPGFIFILFTGCLFQEGIRSETFLPGAEVLGDPVQDYRYYDNSEPRFEAHADVHPLDPEKDLVSEPSGSDHGCNDDH